MKKIPYFFLLFLSFLSCKQSPVVGENKQITSQNLADCYYALATKLDLSSDEATKHLIKAARLGHIKALENVLDSFYFMSNDLRKVNPELAYDIYSQAKKTNPSLKIFTGKESGNEDGNIAILRQCLEAGPFDANAFIKKYNLKDNDINNTIAICDLAEEASTMGRFGPSNPKLVFQLVSRSSGDLHVWDIGLGSLEFEAYKYWLEKKKTKFNFWDFISSESRDVYGTSLEEKAANKRNLHRVENIARTLKNNSGIYLSGAYNSAYNYIEEKAYNEEGHGGSGRSMWAMESTMFQKKEFLDLVEKINKGVKADTLLKIRNQERKLNEIYKTVITKLKSRPIQEDPFGYPVNEEGVRSAQKLWLIYRDTCAKLFSRIDPSIDENIWKNYLTEIRIKNLRDILELWNNTSN